MIGASWQQSRDTVTTVVLHEGWRNEHNLFWLFGRCRLRCFLSHMKTHLLVFLISLSRYYNYTFTSWCTEQYQPCVLTALDFRLVTLITSVHLAIETESHDMIFFKPPIADMVELIWQRNKYIFCISSWSYCSWPLCFAISCHVVWKWTWRLFTGEKEFHFSSLASRWGTNVSTSKETKRGSTRWQRLHRWWAYTLRWAHKLPSIMCYYFNMKLVVTGKSPKHVHTRE